MLFNTDYHPVPGPGYVGDDGVLHGGVTLWAFREMMKRSAVLQHSLGKRQTSLMPHMTTVNVLPVVHFISCNSCAMNTRSYEPNR